MEKTKMLECLIQHYTNGNKAKFAAQLGVKPQTLSAWITRNTFDAEIIYANCRGVSADWLLNGGEGEMIRPIIGNCLSDSSNAELLMLCKSLVANYRQRDEVMSKLVSMVKGIE